MNRRENKDRGRRRNEDKKKKLKQEGKRKSSTCLTEKMGDNLSSRGRKVYKQLKSENRHRGKKNRGE